MATLLDALSQENLDNQREVVKNEKRQSYDNRPYGSFYEKLMARGLPARTTRTTTRPSARWRTSTRPRLEDVIALLPDLVRAQQRGAHDRGRRGRGARRSRPWSGYFGPIPANPDLPAWTPPRAGAA